MFTFDEKKILNEIIVGLKDTIEAKSIHIIRERMELAKLNAKGFENRYDGVRIMRDLKT